MPEFKKKRKMKRLSFVVDFFFYRGNYLGCLNGSNATWLVPALTGHHCVLEIIWSVNS
jgi:hypothetical protein